MKKIKRKLLILLIVIVTLILLGFFLGFFIQWFINNRIDETQGVSGDIGRVLLNPLQGIYSIQNTDLALTSAAIDIPVIRVERASVNINWGQLLSGNIVGRIYIDGVEIRQIIKLPPEKAPDPQGPPLTSVFRNLAPVELDFIRLVRGTIVIRDETKSVPFEIDITEFRGQISNLTNSAELSDSLYATAKGQGVAKGTGALNVNMTFDPVAADLQFHLVMDINGMHLTRFNDYVSELAGLSFEKGTLSIHADINADRGIIQGSVQSTYENMTILDPEANQNFLKQLRDAVTGLLGEIVEDEENRIVTRVPVNMKVKGTRPDVLVYVVNMIQKTIERAAIPVAGEAIGEVE